MYNENKGTKLEHIHRNNVILKQYQKKKKKKTKKI
jgi:hypothetical protein